MSRTTTIALLLCFVTAASVVHGQGHSAILEQNPPGSPPGPNLIYNVGTGSGPTCVNMRLQQALDHPTNTPRVDALTYGRDFGHYKNTHSFFLFSVSCEPGGSKGAFPRTPLYREPRSECEADLYWVQDRRITAPVWGTHGKASDENTASPVATDFPRNNFFQVSPCLDLEGTYGSPATGASGAANLQAFDFWPGTGDEDLYFSIDRTVTYTWPTGSETFGPADILRLRGGVPAEPEHIDVIQRATYLGLTHPDHDIDGLAINLQGLSFEGDFVPLFPPTGWFSLRSAPGIDGADIYQIDFDPDGITLMPQATVPHRSSESMGIFASIDTDVDTLGHIDPEVTQTFSSWAEVTPGGDGGFSGVTVDPMTGFIEFGSGFGPFHGSYSIAVDSVPLVTEDGAFPPFYFPLLATSLFEPGNLVFLEFAGQKLARDVIDQVVVQMTSPVPSVTNVVATANSGTGTVTWSWTNPPGLSAIEVRLNDEVVATAPNNGPDSHIVGSLGPGEHFLEIRVLGGSDKSEPAYGVANIAPPVEQPPHSLVATVVENMSCPNQQDVELAWINPPAVTDVEVFQNGVALATTGGQFCTVSCVAPGLHRFDVRGLVSGVPTIETEVRVFVPIPNPIGVPSPNSVFTPTSLPTIAMGAPMSAATTTAMITVVSNHMVHDVDLVLKITHDFPEALCITLTSPAGTMVTVFDTIGLSTDCIDRHVDGFCDPSPPASDVHGTTPPPVPPGEPDLSSFDGEAAAGIWIVTVKNSAGVTGTFDTLELCLNVEPMFLRGDCNGDETLDIGDPIRTLNGIFGPPPIVPFDCDDACDMNDDGGVNIADAVSSLNVLFGGFGIVPLPPYPDCGVDPTLDMTGCDFGCP